MSDVKHNLFRETLLYKGIMGGVEIALMADIPLKGSGFDSSSSFTVGLLNALSDYNTIYFKIRISSIGVLY